jgi:hypothetical protein
LKMFRTPFLRVISRPVRPNTLFRTRPRFHSTDVKPSSLDRINRRLPKILHKYTRALANAPLSHITSFLILHELTAIIPLFGLAAYFHYTHWLPSWFAEGAFVLSGVERFGRYFRQKGWIRSGEAEEAEREILLIHDVREGIHHDAESGEIGGKEEEKRLRKVDKAWNVSEGGVRLVVEFATAYAITKALLVPRIMFSVWATPSFAKWTVVPVVAKVGKLFKRGKLKTGSSPAGRTGAVDGGVVPKGGGGKAS